MKPEEYQALLDRAIQSKKPYEEAAEVSRGVYGGEYNTGKAPGEPSSTWNYFRIATQNILARMVSSDPVPQVRSKEARFNAVATLFQKQIEARLNESSIVPSYRASVQDAIMYGNGFLYVEPDGNVEYLNYFDVYTDNAKSTTSDLSKGRYLFIRRLYDKQEFMAEFDVPEAEIETVEDVPGRSVVGASVDGDDWSMKPDSTQLWLPNSVMRSYEGSGNNLDGDEDGLVEVYECFVTDSKSESGWKQQFYHNKTLLGEVELPAYMYGPPVVAFSFESISGQFYQPGLYAYLQHTQKAIGYISQKTLRNIALIDFPPLITSKQGGYNAYKSYRFTPGEVLEVSDKAHAPEVMKLPSVPDQYLKYRQELKEDLREEAGIHEIADGGADDSTSGVALQTLAHQTNIRVGLLMTSIEEGLRDLARIMVLTLYAGMQKDDPELEAIKPEQIAKDFVFDFVITPQMTREERIDHLLKAVQVMAPLANGDPVLALKLAAVATQTEELAKSFIDVMQEQGQPVQPEQPPQPQPQPIPPEMMAQGPPMPGELPPLPPTPEEQLPMDVQRVMAAEEANRRRFE